MFPSNVNLVNLFSQIRSQTGSGKTLTYAVPILNKLVNISPKIKRTDGIQAIVVVPTRELALQTHELFGKLNVSKFILSLLVVLSRVVIIHFWYIPPSSENRLLSYSVESLLFVHGLSRLGNIRA